MAGIRYKGQIFSGSASTKSADEVSYDNSDSGLTATDVQGAVDELNSNEITKNLKSITRIVASDTTGASGNLILPYENDGTTFVVGAHAYGTNVFLRTWVSGTNNHWYFTAVDPNSGATLNNTSINYRYLLIKLYSAT